MQDIPFLRQSLQRVVDEFGEIKMIELGVANGGTTIGIYNWCAKNNVNFRWQGCDIIDGEPYFDLGSWGRFYCGDFHTSKIVKAVEGGANLLFIDGCHCYNCVTDDFMLYSPKLAPKGFLLFHDTCSHKSWQDHHKQCKPDKMIETRRALKDLNLLPLNRTDYAFWGEQNEGTTQGMALFQKL
jgi:hypothetical protein